MAAHQAAKHRADRCAAAGDDESRQGVPLIPPSATAPIKARPTGRPYSGSTLDTFEKKVSRGAAGSSSISATR
jgi:hypothetical protein